MLTSLLEPLLDSLKLLPFLFLTYLLMEYLEHASSTRLAGGLQRAGRLGPLFGAAMGIVPQCGFSVAASGLYSGRVISLGTLIAVFLSTSDEMLPVLISNLAPARLIFAVLGVKFVIACIAGFVIDAVLRSLFKAGAAQETVIGEVCQEEGCHCDEHGILYSALLHTLRIFLFLLLLSVGLHLLVEWIGEDTLGSFIRNRPVLSPLLAGLIGLIPNCAASVVVTELYLEGMLSLGGMLAGLLAGAGVGVLALFRMNRRHLTTNLAVVGLLYGIGVLCGILADAVVKLW